MTEFKIKPYENFRFLKYLQYAKTLKHHDDNFEFLI